MALDSSKKGVIDEKTRRKIVLSYGGDENVGASVRLYFCLLYTAKPLPDGGKPVDADLEARAAEMKNSGKITLTAQEVRRGLVAPIQRATTIATDSLAKPTGVGQNVEGDVYTRQALRPASRQRWRSWRGRMAVSYTHIDVYKRQGAS